MQTTDEPISDRETRPAVPPASVPVVADARPTFAQKCAAISLWLVLVTIGYRAWQDMNFPTWRELLDDEGDDL